MKKFRHLRSVIVLGLLFFFGLVSVQASVQASPTALGQGSCARVINSKSAGGLAVRVHPATGSTLIRRMADGTVVRITGASITFGGYTWWPHDGGGGRNNSGWSASNYLQETNCTGKPAYTATNQLNQEVQLYTNTWAVASTLNGSKYVKWTNSIYGKPGQFPLAAPITSRAGMRSANLYKAIIQQFAVGINPRYARDNYTYCNTYAGDVMRAMGVPFPVKSGSDPATLAAAPLYKWLVAGNGWTQVNPRTASGMATLINHVNAGKPALAATSGHVAVIRPQSTPSSYTYLYLAQAGATNSNSLLLRNAWTSSSSWPTIKFFIRN